MNQTPSAAVSMPLAQLTEKRMALPRRLNLNYNVTTDSWDLTDDQTGKLVKSFLTKEAATKKGVLQRIVGTNGGTVLIRKKGGVFEEERRFQGA